MPHPEAAAPLSEAAPAKINLFLRVVGRRPDGYHLLESLVVFAAAGDRLTARSAPGLSLSVDGPFAAGLAGEGDNLVLRAARALAAQAGCAAHAGLQLHKALPVASGIGGGSADAAAALRVLARLWRVPPASAPLALSLGADVPVCLASAPCIMRGIGEVIAPAPILPPFGLALVNPGVAVATPAIFRARTGGFASELALPSAWPDAAALARDVAAWGNDLQAPAIALCPAIADVLAAIRETPGCLAAQMSGSGATCFGIYADAAWAAAAADLLRRPGWWAQGGGLHPPPPDAIAAFGAG